jgi:hypothetical protein
MKHLPVTKTDMDYFRQIGIAIDEEPKAEYTLSRLEKMLYCLAAVAYMTLVISGAIEGWKRI